MPKESMQGRTGGPGGLRRVEGLTHLPEDLGLARNERIEPGGHPEEMVSSRHVAEPVERGLKLGLREAGERRELVQRALRASPCLRAGEVDLRPVARREHGGFAVASREAGQSLAATLGREGHELAKLDWSVAVRGSDEDQRHQK